MLNYLIVIIKLLYLFRSLSEISFVRYLCAQTLLPLTARSLLQYYRHLLYSLHGWCICVFFLFIYIIYLFICGCTASPTFCWRCMFSQLPPWAPQPSRCAEASQSSYIIYFAL